MTFKEWWMKNSDNYHGDYDSSRSLWDRAQDEAFAAAEQMTVADLALRAKQAKDANDASDQQGR